MSKALYRKYRSKKLSEIVGQEHITQTLDNALKTGKISHAYLFTGPKGVGKTSIARILAHEINQLPYADESIHMDIIEIDAASNRGVEDIRSLREKVHIAPTSAKYKVYIIDEAHMLTKEAFNALLKTLEEPPAHVVFILATTELHKMPETIVSRAQRFTFKPIDSAAAVKHLRQIADSEGMEIDDEALELLAIHGRGSFRDSISLLDQVGHSAKKVTRDVAERLVGLASAEHIDALMQAALHGTPADILRVLDQFLAAGISPGQAARQLAGVLRRAIMSGDASDDAVSLLGSLLDVNGSSDPAGKLEVVLLEANLRSRPAATPAESRARTAEASVPSQAKKPHDEAEPEAAVTPAVKPEPVAPTSESPDTALKVSALPDGEIADWWEDALTQIKAINNTLYGAMRMATPRIEGDTLHLGFKFGLHAKKATEAGTQAKIVKAIEKVSGKVFQINAVVDKTLSAAPAAAKSKNLAPAADPQLDSVKNIFGGAEVLES